MNAAIDDTTTKAIIKEIAVVIDVNTDVSSGFISVYISNGITVAIDNQMALRISLYYVLYLFKR